MADQKVTELVEELSPALTDLLYMVDDPAGVPISKKVTVANFLDVQNFVGFRTRMTSDEALVSGVPEVLPFDIENFDVGSYFNTGTYRWTPPAGYAIVYLNLMYNNSTQNGQVAVIYMNGGGVNRLASRPYTSAGGSSAAVLWMGPVDGTDFFEAVGVHYRGSDMDVDAGHSWFMGFVIPQS